MEDSSSPSSNNNHIPSSPSKPPKSKFLFFTNYYVTKSFMIILVFLVFSFFSSQVPEIFKETTLIPKLWDLIYLLVIGIAVCYGLFSRKADSVHPSDDNNNNNNNNIGGSETYLSGISHISSIFEDGNHGVYGFDEKSWNLGSRSREIGDVKKVKNQLFLGESLVVINDEKFVLEQLGSRQKKSKQKNLGSKSLDSAAGKSVVEDSDSRNWFKESKSGKFRGLMPVKLEQKFKETENGSDSDSDSRTRVNWRSKSMRLEKRDDMFTSEVNESDVFDFKGVKSQSVRFGMSSRIKNLSEKEESKSVEAVELNHRYRKPYLNGETSFMESKIQESNTGSVVEMSSRPNATEIEKDFFNGILDGGFEETVKDLGKVKVDDGTFESKNKARFVKSKSQSSSSIGASTERDQQTSKNMLRKEEKSDISNSIPKPATNTYKRGKSVRTSRLKEQVVESKVNTFQSQTDDDDEVETRSKLGVEEMDVKADELSDTEPHSGEVDRKAEEFIARFREQIRLQKVASARKLNLL